MKVLYHQYKIIWRRQLIQIKMKSSVFVWSLCLYVFIYITLKKQLNKYDTNHKIMQTYINKNLTAVSNFCPSFYFLSNFLHVSVTLRTVKTN